MEITNRRTITEKYTKECIQQAGAVVSLLDSKSYSEAKAILKAASELLDTHSFVKEPN